MPMRRIEARCREFVDAHNVWALCCDICVGYVHEHGREDCTVVGCCEHHGGGICAHKEAVQIERACLGLRTESDRDYVVIRPEHGRWKGAVGVGPYMRHLSLTYDSALDAERGVYRAWLCVCAERGDGPEAPLVIVGDEGGKTPPKSTARPLLAEAMTGAALGSMADERRALRQAREGKLRGPSSVWLLDLLDRARLIGAPLSDDAELRAMVARL